MVRSSYLRVYQALSRFSPEERTSWGDQPDLEPADAVRSSRWLVGASLTALERSRSAREGAFVRRVGDDVMVCPWRTRLRMLAGVLAFRGSVPAEVAEAFVPETEARRAASELAELDARQPGVRSHILHANWHVPLRWFTAFAGEDRVLVEDRRGLRLRYEADLADAKERMGRALRILEEHWGEDDVTGAMRELTEWLEQFEGEGLVELDYGSVAAMFDPDSLVADRSAADVWACLEAMEGGDLLRAGRIFASLMERWAGVRVLEAVN